MMPGHGGASLHSRDGTFVLALFRCNLVSADAHYFSFDDVTPGARTAQVDQHLSTVVVP